MKHKGKIFMVVLLGYLPVAFAENDKIQPCGNINQDEAIKIVTEDFFTYRIPRWTFATQALGTNKPEVHFLIKDFQVTDNYFMPFMVQGIKAKIPYYATFSCINGTIEYSFDDPLPLNAHQG